MFQSTSCLNDQVSIHVSKYNMGDIILKESENTTEMDKVELLQAIHQKLRDWVVSVSSTLWAS